MIKALSGTLNISIFRIRSDVFFKYVFCSVAIGCKKKSMNSDILSKGQLFAEIIGLAFGGGSGCI